VTKTLIYVDEELLDVARAVLRVTTKKDAVNGAVRELVRLGAIREWLTAFQSDWLEQFRSD
jgi:Arc/MetJ family transcription regulator